MIFCLRPVPTLLISIPSYALVIYALAGDEVEPMIAYAEYFLSAYSLNITITRITGIMCLVRQGTEQHPLTRKMRGIPLVERFLKEDAFRAESALYRGFFIIARSTRQLKKISDMEE